MKEILKEAGTFLGVGFFFFCDKTEHLLDFSCCFFLRLERKHMRKTHTYKLGW